MIFAFLKLFIYEFRFGQFQCILHNQPGDLLDIQLFVSCVYFCCGGVLDLRCTFHNANLKYS